MYPHGVVERFFRESSLAVVVRNEFPEFGQYFILRVPYGEPFVSAFQRITRDTRQEIDGLKSEESVRISLNDRLYAVIAFRSPLFEVPYPMSVHRGREFGREVVPVVF